MKIKILLQHMGLEPPSSALLFLLTGVCRNNNSQPEVDNLNAFPTQAPQRAEVFSSMNNDLYF